VDRKLENAVSATINLGRSANRIVKKCKNCRKQVSKTELQRLVHEFTLGTVMYVSENQTVQGGAESIRSAVAFWNRIPTVPQAKLSSFEFLESANVAQLTRGKYSAGVPEVVLDNVFQAMFGCRPTKQIFLRLCDGSTRSLRVPSRTHTVQCLKLALEEQVGIPCTEQCLLHNGRELSDRKRLADECRVTDSSCVSVMLRVAGGVRVVVKTQSEVFEIDVNPADTVESMMKRLHHSTAGPQGPCTHLELCLPEQPSAHEIISQLASMVNQQSAQLWQMARSWHAPSCTLSDPNFGDLDGIDSCLQHYCDIAAALSDIAVVVNRTSTDNGQGSIKVWWTLSAMHIGPILGIVASGNRFTISGTCTHQIEDGSILSTEWSWGAMGFMRQVGLPSMPAHQAQPAVSARPTSGSLHDSDSEYTGSQSGASGAASPDSFRMAEAMAEASVEESLDWFIENETGVGIDDIDIMDLLDGGELNFALPPPTAQQVKVEPQPNTCLELVGLTGHKNLKREAPAHGDLVCLQYLDYQCGYCKVVKVSTSTGGDGRVRIRCECGGKHQDGKPRMHAKWKLFRTLSPEAPSPVVAAIQPPDQFETDFISSLVDVPFNKRVKL